MLPRIKRGKQPNNSITMTITSTKLCFIVYYSALTALMLPFRYNRRRVTDRHTENQTPSHGVYYACALCATYATRGNTNPRL